MPRSQTLDFTTAPQGFRSQWTHLGDVFSVLLILGSDVISRALAQLAGGALTPVAFLFGEFGVIQSHAPYIELSWNMEPVGTGWKPRLGSLKGPTI